MDVVGGLAAHITGTPLILTERASAPAYLDSWKDKLRAFVGKRATAIVANSEAGRSYWIGRGYRGVVRVIRNGIPLADIEKAPRADLGRWRVPAGNRVIVFAGRYTEQKNIMLMLEAFEHVVRKRADVTALLFGDGPLRAEAERRIRTSGLADRIKVGGYCDSLWAVMKAADVFVTVSTFEGNPNTVLEAMAVKCPLVVSDIPEHREFLGESNAYFATPSSADDVAAAIGRALDNREEAHARAEAAHRLAGGWSVESQAKEYMDLYNEILRNRLRLGQRRYG